ncbi:hypothetical protein PVL30_003731 [Lodderomyces elongisporus]|uniref:uncharacterized protein n=1 Tax=Lodderomyces elongisporus TaxID=36914 RepID=UPI002922E8AF|nr:uncharacterized protein PVL30_003731 [Lodderomyces elongisporus]WLF79964.1 hypothetical protein PVL30_003731 [Lodderomyces elongisporus]
MENESNFDQSRPPSQSSSSSQTSRSGGKRSFYRNLAVNLANTAVTKGNNIIQKNPGSKRAIAAGTASTILEMGIDRYGNLVDDSSRSLPSSMGRHGSVDLTEEQINHIASMAESADEAKSPKQSNTQHFADKLIEKLLRSSLPDEVPEKELFEERLNNPDRVKRPGLSFPILISNLKQLGSKMTNLFALQYEIINIVAWRKPNKTLSVLVLYTAACMWPHLILVYPLLFVLFGMLLPGYTHRHPPRRPDLIKVKSRGQSLFKFLNATEETSIVEDLVDTEYLKEDADIADVNSTSYTMSEAESDNTKASTAVSVSSQGGTESSEKSDKKKEVSKRRKRNLDLLVNLRDMQNSMTDLLKLIEEGETFYYETAGFKDERLSTFIFYGVLVATFGAIFFGQFIPWRLIFIQSGWIGLTLCHPKVKKFLVDFGAAKKRRSKVIQRNAEAAQKADPTAETTSNKGLKQLLTQLDRNDIIVDDSPEVRLVEVYELEIKSILQNDWKFYRYSNTIYDRSNKNRLSGKRPPGVDHLSKVFPPTDWKFDAEFVNKWVLDTNPMDFIKQRTLDASLFVIKDDENEGWIYDNMKNVVNSEIVYEFRRRRLYRECFRYGKSHRKPAIK